jgi:uncharacterized membrane protein YgcG
MKMKKFSVIILFVIMLTGILSISAAAEGEKIFLLDEANFFSDSEEESLRTSMNTTANDVGWNIVILSYEGDYSESEAKALLDAAYNEKFGSTPGAGYIMTTEVGKPAGQNDYQIYVETYGGVDFSSESFLDRVEDRFLDYQEYASAKAFLAGCVPYTGSGSSAGSGFYVDITRIIYPGLIYAAIPSCICIAVVIARYKSHPRISATRYLDQNETRFYRREDNFVREYTTRTHIDRSSGGSRGGGGRRSGGGFSGGGRSGRR